MLKPSGINAHKKCHAWYSQRLVCSALLSAYRRPFPSFVSSSSPLFFPWFSNNRSATRRKSNFPFLLAMDSIDSSSSSSSLPPPPPPPPPRVVVVVVEDELLSRRARSTPWWWCLCRSSSSSDDDKRRLCHDIFWRETTQKKDENTRKKARDTHVSLSRARTLAKRNARVRARKPALENSSRRKIDGVDVDYHHHHHVVVVVAAARRRVADRFFLLLLRPSTTPSFSSKG